MTDLLVPNAARGKPPPIDFARQIMSGVTPKYSLAPPQQSFAPVFTSSKIRSAPFLLQISRRPLRNPGCGMQRPTFIKIGSRIMAAISPGFFLKRRSTVARLLKVAISTLAMADFGTPRPPETAVGLL